MTRLHDNVAKRIVDNVTVFAQVRALGLEPRVLHRHGREVGCC